MFPSLVHPLHCSSSSSPLLKMTLAGFNVPYSHMCRKQVNHIHPSLPSSFTLPSDLSPLDMPCPTLFESLFIVRCGCALVFYLLIYCTSTSLTLSITPPCPFPYPILLNSFQCVSLCFFPTEMQCISVSFTLYHSLSLLSWSPLTIPLLEMCSVCIFISICLYLYLSSIYERKRLIFFFLNLAYFT
jgi:hypothetical protein